MVIKYLYSIFVSHSNNQIQIQIQAHHQRPPEVGLDFHHLCTGLGHCGGRCPGAVVTGDGRPSEIIAKSNGLTIISY